MQNKQRYSSQVECQSHVRPARQQYGRLRSNKRARTQLTEQAKSLTRSSHLPLLAHVTFSHSSMSTSQLSPVNPGVHRHMYEPRVFKQMLLTEQALSDSVEHSSTSSSQFSPRKPPSHVHVNEPKVFVHTALAPQAVVGSPRLPCWHSSTSSSQVPPV